MQKFSFIASFLLFFVSSSFANDVQFRDSVTLQEVVVTGSVGETNPQHLPTNITVVSSQQIGKRFEQSLLPVIMEAVPGLFITSRGIMGYGVSNGAAGGMSVRGIGGSPTTGILLLIDGHPQFMGMMGHPLPDSYQSLMAEQVEVVQGPVSALYGSNALGGVINIITKKQLQDDVRTGVRAMYGSYNTLSSEINNAVRKGKFKSYLSLNYNRSDGHRENMDFEQYSGYGKVGYDISGHWETFVDLNLSNFKASNPGMVSSPMLDNDADIVRGMTSFSLENKYEQTSGALKFFYNFGSHKINDGYKLTETADSEAPRFRSNDDMFGLSLYQSYRFFQGNQVTAKLDYQRFGGLAKTIYLNGKPDTILADKALYDIAGYLNIRQVLFEKLVLNAGLRWDKNEQTGTEWVPQAGLNYIPGKNTVIKAIVSKGFRNPTIREMYMFPPQNPDLEPERLMNYELSASQELFEQALLFNLNLYYIKGDNSIQTLPINNVPKNINTGEIENYGLEFSSRCIINSQWSVSANYAWLHMKNKVIASPEHKLYGDIHYNCEKWTISTGMQYINNLYTAIQTPQTTEQKESFLLWNLRASYQANKVIELFAKGENLLAQEYEINAGYPMPRASVFGGIYVNF
jgi:iron complex outermembrane receptor protein